MSKYEPIDTRCSLMCFSYWAEHPYNPVMICPGCMMWRDEEGRIWRQGLQPTNVVLEKEEQK